MKLQSLDGFWQKRVFGSVVLSAIVALSLWSTAAAEKKDKAPLPELVVKAQTVAVLILPGARESAADPFGDRKAQEDVEKGLIKWGRFQLTQEAFTADLVLGVRKGTGHVVEPTVGGPPSDTRPTTVETTDNAIRVGVQKGRLPGDNEPDNSTGAGVQGGPEDSLELFLGGDQYKAGNAPVWICRKTDGLKPPTMSALEQFRKAVEETENAVARKQKQPSKQKNP